jgi:hypothetical protein
MFHQEQLEEYDSLYSTLEAGLVWLMIEVHPLPIWSTALVGAETLVFNDNLFLLMSVAPKKRKETPWGAAAPYFLRYVGGEYR